jgi:hypothetical protein
MKVEEAARDPGNPLPACKHMFSTTLGMPCAHKLGEITAFNGKLMKEDFDQQWWLSNEDATLLIPEEPVYASVAEIPDEQERIEHDTFVQEEYEVQMTAIQDVQTREALADAHAIQTIITEPTVSALNER